MRPYVHAAHAFIIPLLVGGGTRIKAFEAMAMGCPVVSASIGIEGLDAQDGRDYLRRGDAASIAAAILDLVSNTALRDSLSRAACKLVKERFRFRVAAAAAAAAFERICLDTPARN